MYCTRKRSDWNFFFWWMTWSSLVRILSKKRPFHSGSDGTRRDSLRSTVLSFFPHSFGGRFFFHYNRRKMWWQLTAVREHIWVLFVCLFFSESTKEESTFDGHYPPSWKLPVMLYHLVWMMYGIMDALVYLFWSTHCSTFDDWHWRLNISRPRKQMQEK